MVGSARFHVRLRLVFTKVRERRRAKVVMRYPRRGNLLLPVRPLHGPAPHVVVLRPVDSARVIHILKNPAYAGAYVYGRRRPDPIRRQPGSGRIGTIATAPEEWAICLKDTHSAYADWNEFMASQRQLADHLNHYDKDRRGVPRKGRALLQGIVCCGRCARRQYDAVEPENRLVARSLERVREEKLRRAEQIEQEYDVWRREQSVSIAEADRQQILALGENLPALWHASMTTAADRKQIARLVVKEVALDQKRRRGFVWIRVIWQTGTASEHWVQRQVQSYMAHGDADQIRNRIIELNALQKLDGEIATILNDEGFRLRTARHFPAT
jgi:hypothetical protein